MSVRQALYGWFENFDKPDEDQFRVFIDAALGPTTYKNDEVVPDVDLYTDLNVQTYVLDVRECYFIKYGDALYILSGLEGTYGSGGIEIDITNLTYVANMSLGSLVEPLTANTSIPEAGIKSGDSYPVGTEFETLFRDLLTNTKISNLRFQANDTSGFMEIGTTLSITKFLWDAAGTPSNLYLEDADAQFGQSVTGTEVSVTEDYTYNAYKELVWTLSGDNVDSITDTVYWVEPSYYGTNTTGSTPTEGEILAGVKVLVLTENFISVPINTAVSQHGWITVDSTQANGLYTRWEVSEFSSSAIGSSEFIKYAGDVTVNGKTHNVYIFNWKSEVDTLKLS